MQKLILRYFEAGMGCSWGPKQPIAMEDGGQGIMFSVGADGSVTGHEMPAQVIQMLMQPGAQR